MKNQRYFKYSCDDAKFLRALMLFYLVQQWGDVPMPLTETQSASKEANRVPSAEIYSQILADLLDAESKLPAVASNYGRITKGAAQFLLSKVYLTRGWNFNNSLGGQAPTLLLHFNMPIRSLMLIL